MEGFLPRVNETSFSILAVGSKGPGRRSVSFIVRTRSNLHLHCPIIKLSKSNGSKEGVEPAVAVIGNYKHFLS